MVHSQLLFCSVLWKLHLLKDINAIKRIQREATKCLLNDYSSDYKTRWHLIKLKILPLMYTFNINNVMFLSNFHQKLSTLTTLSRFSSWQYMISKLQHTARTLLVMIFTLTGFLGYECTSCNRLQP